MWIKNAGIVGRKAICLPIARREEAKEAMGKLKAKVKARMLRPERATTVAKKDICPLIARKRAKGKAREPSR